MVECLPSMCEAPGSLPGSVGSKQVIGVLRLDCTVACLPVVNGACPAILRGLALNPFLGVKPGSPLLVLAFGVEGETQTEPSGH